MTDIGGSRHRVGPTLWTVVLRALAGEGAASRDAMDERIARLAMMLPPPLLRLAAVGVLLAREA